jgi:hypothetical protein
MNYQNLSTDLDEFFSTTFQERGKYRDSKDSWGEYGITHGNGFGSGNSFGYGYGEGHEFYSDMGEGFGDGYGELLPVIGLGIRYKNEFGDGKGNGNGVGVRK